ncbi:MAG: hypothetical protein LBB75_09610 [Oscillospiraceae bacterium]|jgi:hypothetical protein|nr:hypothetical protein [Oscillospiraceae bacterium]
MTEQAQKNQAYLQWYFRAQEPRRTVEELEIRPQDIVPITKPAVFTNPWVYKLG